MEDVTQDTSCSHPIVRGLPKHTNRNSALPGSTWDQKLRMKLDRVPGSMRAHLQTFNPFV